MFVRRSLITAIPVVVAVIALSIVLPAPERSEPHSSIIETTSSQLLESITPHLREGAIIFRGKDRSWGDLGAQLSDKDKRFGHVGVVVFDDGQWGVIDAIGNPLDREGRVRLRTVEAFLAPATRAGLYRPSLSDQALDRFLTSIRVFEAAQTPFDRLYDMDDANALYCTELIWLALKTATGEDPVPDHTLFRDRRVIAIDDLQYAPIMTAVWVSAPEADT